MQAKQRHFRQCALAAALAIVGLTTCAQGAAAATKDYGSTVVPKTVPSGVLVDVSATFRNLTAQQLLGSVNLSAPPGYAVQSITSLSRPAPATAALVGGVVQLRNLSLAPQQSATVTMKVQTACAPGVTVDWGDAIVKQANDFNGSPGNDLTFDAARSSIDMTTVGACVPCPEDETCDTDLSASGSALSLLAPPNPNQPDGGLLTIQLPAGQLDCAGYAERGATTFRFDAPSTRGKIGILTYDSTTRPITSKDPLEVCFASPFAFPAKAKTQQTMAILDGQAVFVGLLPNCTGSVPPPCVTARDNTLRQITFTMPEGDPYSR